MNKNPQRLLRPIEKESEMVIIYRWEIRGEIRIPQYDKIMIC